MDGEGIVGCSVAAKRVITALHLHINAAGDGENVLIAQFLKRRMKMNDENSEPAARWRPRACGFCVPGVCPLAAIGGMHRDFPKPGHEGDWLFIPRDVQLWDFSRYELSTRLRNLLAAAEIERLGDLNGRQLSKLLRRRNCGRGMCLELLGLVRHLQHGNWHNYPPHATASSEMDYEI